MSSRNPSHDTIIIITITTNSDSSPLRRRKTPARDSYLLQVTSNYKTRPATPFSPECYKTRPATPFSPNDCCHALAFANDDHDGHGETIREIKSKSAAETSPPPGRGTTQHFEQKTGKMDKIPNEGGSPNLRENKIGCPRKADPQYLSPTIPPPQRCAGPVPRPGLIVF